MSEDRGKYFIFVGGAPRSGTTLVQNMLDSHPDILGGPEFMHLPDIIQLRNRLHNSIKEGRIDIYCSDSDVDKQIRFMIENLLLPIKKKYGGKIVSEKTPGNVIVFSELLELFPESRFIHVVRDPRAIVASMLQVGKRSKKVKRLKTQDFTHNTSAAISYIKKCFENGFGAAQKAPDRIMTVMYEKLVTDPVFETKRICKFLDLEWSSEMISPQNKNHLGEKPTTRSNVWYDENSFNRAPVKTEINKWETQLTLVQKAVIHLSFRNNKVLADLGYNFLLEDLKLGEKIVYVGIGVFWHLIYSISRTVYSFFRKIYHIFYFKIPSPRN
jgi:hypothetical protein